MNRTQIIEREAKSASGGRKFPKQIDVPLPQIFHPAEPAVRNRAALFNLRTKPGYYNAEVKTALLRRDKQEPHDELFIDFSGGDVHVELLAAGRTVAAGPWTCRAAAAGTPLAAAGLWTEVCWHRDDSCDYLEIELLLTGGWKIERQMLLARKDRFLFVADALFGPGEPAEIHYEQRLPLAASAAFQASRETREAALAIDGRQRALAVPLALGEWRAEFAPGEMQFHDGQLALSALGNGKRLYSPLWIDLDARRSNRPRTWRRLSIGENLSVVSRDVAAGYRLQIGGEQWLIYRSLTDFGNRSILGHNTANSFVCGRIKKDGNLEAIVEIE
jgi:hypothetical protein